MDDTSTSRGPDGVELIAASKLTCEPVRWLWKGWLARGKFHLLVGAPAAGKTTIAMAIAAAVSSEGTLPSGEAAQPGKVLIWSGEDDPADTLLPRLLAMGADDSQVFFIGNSTRRGRKQPFDPAQDMSVLQSEIERRGGVALLILDPVVGAIRGDSHRNAEVRRELQPVVDIAERTGVAVLGITHMAKGTAGRDPTERVIGSIAFAAVARVIMIANQGSDGGVLALAKNNLAPSDGGYRYSLESVESERVNAVRVDWGAKVSGSARELLGQQEIDLEIGRSALQEASEWLDTFLGHGPAPTTQIEEAAEAAGIAWRTVQRAKSLLGVRARKTANGWVWDAKTAN